MVLLHCTEPSMRCIVVPEYVNMWLILLVAPFSIKV